MTCPRCSAEAGSGSFCPNCGSPLGKVTCPNCAQEAPAGARFCNLCGAAMAGRSRKEPGGPAARVGWWMGGALIAGLILVVAYPVYGPDRQTTDRPERSSGATGASAVDLSSMTPREAADRLFNRVMTAVSSDDSSEVINFLPMAIRAYELAEPLDADGKFHLSLLHLTATLNEEGLADVEEILDEQPDHLLGLAAAADASLALGDTASARVYYRRWLDVYDTEIARNVPEYGDHAQMMPEMRAKAEALVGND